MQITVQAKMLPTKEQAVLLSTTTKEYIRAVNVAVTEYVAAGENHRRTFQRTCQEL